MKIYNTPQEVLNAMNEKFKDIGLPQYTLQEAIDMWGIDEPGVTEDEVNKWVERTFWEINDMI